MNLASKPTEKMYSNFFLQQSRIGCRSWPDPYLKSRCLPLYSFPNLCTVNCVDMCVHAGAAAAGGGGRSACAQRLMSRRHFITRTRTQGSELMLIGGAAVATKVVCCSMPAAAAAIPLPMVASNGLASPSPLPSPCGVCSSQNTLRSCSLRLQLAERAHGTWAAALQAR